MDVVKVKMRKTSLPAAFSYVLMVVGKNEREVRVHILPLAPAEVITWVEDYEGSEPSSGLGQGGGLVQHASRDVHLH